MNTRYRPRSAMDASTAQAFELHVQELQHAWTLAMGAIGFVLVPLFVVLDWFTMPRELFGLFAMYRGVVTGFILVQIVIVRFTRPSRFSVLHGYFFTVVVGGMIAWMTVDLGGFDSTYYAGLNLVLAANLLLPWSASHTTLNALTTLGMYVVLNTLFGGAFHAASVVNNLFFLGGTAVMAVATNAVKYRLIEREFTTRNELVEANRNLDRSRAELQAARDALWGEMEVAKRIQTALLPTNKRVGAYDVAARMLPAAEVGGDYYDIIEHGGDRNWVAIGDVSGHGVESGLVMMMTQTSILSLVQENPRLTPAEVFHQVNSVLLENISRLRAARYMTLNVVQLREDGLMLAGKHQDVLVWRAASRRVDTVANEGCWIGIVEDTRGHVLDQAIPMAEGDIALFFTDGATEAMNAAGEMFGDVRLAESLARVAEKPLEEALEALFADIAAFRSVQDDDVTLMLVRRATRADAERADAGAAPSRPPGAPPTPRSSAA